MLHLKKAVIQPELGQFKGKKLIHFVRKEEFLAFTSSDFKILFANNMQFYLWVLPRCGEVKLGLWRQFALTGVSLNIWAIKWTT